MPRTQPFEKYSAQYEDWFERNFYAYQSELKAVSHFLPHRGKGIEIGVGTGRFAAPLGIKVGVEPSQAMGKLAEARGVRVYSAVAEQLPFEIGSFDYALMVTTICFVDDLPASFREVARILKNHGTFIIGFVDRDSPLGMTYEKHKYESVFYREATFYSTQEVLGLLAKTGFEETGVVQTIFGSLSDINAIQEFKLGYGEGSFIVIRAKKIRDSHR